MSTRIIFSFDPGAFEQLQWLKRETNAASFANVVREGLRFQKAYLDQSREGFTEIILRNPRNNSERKLIF